MNALKPIFLAATLTAFPACSQAGPVSGSADKAAVEKIVYDYLMENPEVISEALVALETKQDQSSITAANTAIYDDKRDVVLGPDDAKVTIVEFFDYNCGYCKRSTNWLVSTIESHPKNVRVIFKELPILDGRTKTSRLAAKAAIAANRQGKYLEMHTALMKAKGLSDARIDDIAKSAGVDVAQMRKDMADPAIATHIEDTMVLGQRLRPMTGTPFFMIGDEFMAGANVDRLNAMLDKALKG